MSNYSDDRFLRELFKSYRQMMFKIAVGILHNNSDAEDAVQDAFLYIIKNLEKISQIPCNKRACYFANIIEHISLNIINRKRVHPTDDIDEYDELNSNISVEKTAVGNITVDEIKQAIRAMSEKDRLLLRLYLFEKLSYKEISETTGISEGNARTYVHRAKKRLAGLLREKGIDYEY